jgi:hypothetical protein
LIITIDGPEKAGKTTLLTEVVRQANAMGFRTRVRHHGKECAGNNGGLYASNLFEDQDLIKSLEGIQIWDRAWPSEWVYGTLMGRESSPIQQSPQFVESTLGQITRAYGVTAILLGPDPESLTALRTADDHPVDPVAERALYEQYGRTNTWITVQNKHTQDAVVSLARELIFHAQRNRPRSKA